MDAIKALCLLLLTVCWHSRPTISSPQLQRQTLNTITSPPNLVADDHAYENISVVDVLSDIPDLDEFCWSEQLSACSIIGNFTQTAISLSFPVNIDCDRNINRDFCSEANERGRPNAHKYFCKRFQHIQIVSLNGCGVNVANRRKKSNYRNVLGIEYIPDPLSVRHLTLEMFKVYGEMEDDAFVPFKYLKTLLLTNNKIERLSGASLNGLNFLEELIIHENRIQMIHPTFIASNDSLKRLIIRESYLMLGDLQPMKQIVELVVSAKQMNWTALTIGVSSLKTATISNVGKIVFPKIAPRTFNNLTKLEVTFCRMQEFPVDRYPRLLHFNISHNALRNISMKEMQMLGLQTLDISFNEFITVDGTLLASLWDLEYFYVTHNKLVAINPKAFQKNYNLKVIDLRFNRLKRLTIDQSLFISAKQVKLNIDNNPFNCAWINEYYGYDPPVFTTKLLYTKDFSDVNIKGLRCKYYSGDFRYHSHLYDDDDQYHNGIKRGRPPDPVTILRRNPKHTVVITVCILIIGVSSLLISLYFYVKYRTLATTLHGQPVYETLSPNKRPKSKAIENRPDVIQDRESPANSYDSPHLSRSVDTINKSQRSMNADHHHSHFASIEFKDSFEEIREKHKLDQHSNQHFDSAPIGAQNTVADIEPDTVIN